jgi:GTP-binding nuclear protein Ran
MLDSKFKIALVGDRSTGKASFLKNQLNPLIFHTNYGPVTFEISNNYQDVQGIICLFDLNRVATGNNASIWIERVRTITPDIPAIICGNKYDLKTMPMLKPQPLRNVKYYNISVKNNYNLEKPFIELARILTGHNELIHVKRVKVTPL